MTATMQTRKNRRGYPERFWKGEHLNLNDLKQAVKKTGLGNQYLYKENIPEYPRPEFHVIHLKHDTNEEGLCGIRRDEGFKAPKSSLLWWNLAVGPEEMRSAETRLLENTFPDRMEEQAATQQSFLWKFATSPAFKETSRLGSYRFTFPLEEVLTAYSEQFCSGEQPVMRVYETVLHKQEFQHTVLVHSPANEEQFSRYPLVSDHPNAVCVYRDGHFIWRPEAMCETHGYMLIQRPNENQMEIQKLSHRDSEFYVWDNVAIALHMNKQALKFGAYRLRENLSFCEKGEGAISQGSGDTFRYAESEVKDLWPDIDSPLKKEISLEQSFTAAGGGPAKCDEDSDP